MTWSNWFGQNGSTAADVPSLQMHLQTVALHIPLRYAAATAAGFLIHFGGRKQK